MSKKTLDVVRYVVRVSGLAVFIALAVILVFSSLAGERRSLLMSLGGIWLVASALLSWPRVPEAWRKDPPTERQLEYAASLGIPVPAGISKGQLSDMITQVTGR